LSVTTASYFADRNIDMSRNISAKPPQIPIYPGLLSKYDSDGKPGGTQATPSATPVVSTGKQNLQEDRELLSKHDGGPATLLVIPAVNMEEQKTEELGGRLPTRFTPYFLAKPASTDLEELEPVEQLDGDEVRSLIEQMSYMYARDLREEVVYLFRGFHFASQRSDSHRAESETPGSTKDIRTQHSTVTGSEVGTDPAAICLSIGMNDGEVELQPYIKPAGVRLRGRQVRRMNMNDVDPDRPSEFEDSVVAACEFATGHSIYESPFMNPHEAKSGAM
jgi:hypothetical protein